MRRIAVTGLAALAVAFGASAAASSAFAAASAANVTATVAAASTAAITAHPAVAARIASAPRPKRQLWAVTCLAATNCVAVGQDLGTRLPLAETWNGARWAAIDLRLPKGTAVGTLEAVSCAAARSCVAVGLSGAAVALGTADAEIPLAESWNGTVWKASRLPAPAGSQGAQLDGISCPSATTCVATGVYILPDGEPAGFAEVLRDGTWSVGKPPGLQHSDRYSMLDNVSCMSAASCVAVGSYGTLASPGGAPAGTAVAESWNGRTWSESTLPVPSGTRYLWLYGVSCTPSKTCVAVGGRYLAGSKATAPVAETWSGGKWRAATPTANGADPVLFAVSCATAAGCLAVGGADTATAAARSDAFADSWNGHGWAFARLPTPPEGDPPNASLASSVSCLSATDCVAVGLAGPAGLLSYGFSGFWNGKGWRLVATS